MDNVSLSSPLQASRLVFAVKYRLLPTTGAGSFKNLILPSITLGVSIAAIIARFTRSSVIEVLKEDYVRTARAKGLREKTPGSCVPDDFPVKDCKREPIC